MQVLLKHCVLCCAVLSVAGTESYYSWECFSAKLHHHQASVPSGTVQTQLLLLGVRPDSIISCLRHKMMRAWASGAMAQICASSCDPHEDRQCRAGHTSAPRNANVLRVWSPATLQPGSLPPDEILGWRKLTRDPVAHSLRDPSRCPVTTNTETKLP